MLLGNTSVFVFIVTQLFNWRCSHGVWARAADAHPLRRSKRPRVRTLPSFSP